MVDFQDPISIAPEYCACTHKPRSVAWKAHRASRVTVVFVKLYHVVGGLYMCVYLVAPLSDRLSNNTLRAWLDPSWEFVTTLDYEWNVIQGRRRYRHTIWVSNS